MRFVRRFATASISLSIAAAAACGTGTSYAAGSTGRIPCTNFSATSAGRVLSFGEVNAMIHPDDEDLFTLAERISWRRPRLAARPGVPHPQRRRRMGLAARPRRVDRRPDDAASQLVGIAVDVTEQRGLEERTASADARLRTPSRRSRKPSCSGTPATAWCSATRNSSKLTNSDRDVACRARATRK